MNPTPQPQSRLSKTDQRPDTLTATINPSIVLMDSHSSLKILLSQNTLVEPRGIQLQRVRLIEIPLGWRLSLIRFVSRFCTVRLPDEFEFSVLRVDIRKTPSLVWSGGECVGQIGDVSLVIPLHASEYRSLVEMSGRNLHKCVAGRFRLDAQAASQRLVDERQAA